MNEAKTKLPTDAGSLQRVVRERLCMVINDQEMCELPATWRVQSNKHMFDMYVCGSHALAFLGMKACKVTPLSNAKLKDAADAASSATGVTD